jgi:hypothetical protein
MLYGHVAQTTYNTYIFDLFMFTVFGMRRYTGALQLRSPPRIIDIYRNHCC